MLVGVRDQNEVPEELRWQIMEAQAKYRHEMLSIADVELLNSTFPGWLNFSYDFPEEKLNELDLAVWLCQAQRRLKLGELAEEHIAMLDSSVPDWRTSDTGVTFGLSYGE